MPSCLGLYIETNLIKYAKVTKDRDLLKVESFGVKFYDSLGEAINQIVSETFSFKTPISINLSEEAYQYFYFFSLLNKNDLKKAIETEFESYCHEKGYNRNALESRYALVQDVQDKERLKTIFVTINKAEINKKIQDTEGNSVSSILPLPMCIPNITEVKEKENILIVNMEEKTTLTTIIEGNIYSVDKIEEGMGSILYNINEKENSYSKAYEICKNTTIYTMEGKELLQEEENVYLEDIMPTLYNIVQKVKEFVDSSLNRIEKIYITGTGCVINNIDLYFQEYFSNMKCEILKPFFISENVKINIKDYIEVNSAIALAMQGLGYGIKDLNFKKPNFADQLPDWLKLDIGNKNKKEGKDNKEKSISIGNKKIDFSFDFKAKWDRTEKWLLRTISGILAFLVIYTAITTFLKIQTDIKLSEIQEVKDDTNNQMILASKDIQSINNKSSDYQKMTENLKNYSNKVTENLKTKNVIPLLLTRIMNVIPQGVTLTSIENTTGTHIVINAQSENYDLLGFFKGSLIIDGILSPSTVVSTSGVKQNGIIKIVIEGDLP
ncbi:MAG: hypothetical protein GX682_03730 [Clostridiaceae bacterium]|nr:hypothetical protein [Clostridiaceae bacterium]